MNVSGSLYEVSSKLRDAMADAGLVTDADIYPTGKIERFHVEGDRRGKRNGWYVLFAGRIASGAFGCWKRGITQTWCEFNRDQLPPRDRAQAREQIRTAMQAAALERAARAQGAAEQAKRDWCRAGQPWPSHTYLTRKQVGGYGIRQLGALLLVPLWGRDRILHSLQYISPDGTKRFVKGGRVGGCFHVLGDIQASEQCWIAEGYATAASVHEYYGEPCLVAFNAGNLAAVARVAREMWASKHWVVMADDDHKTPGNPGRTAAAKALDWADEAHFPTFTDEQKARGLTDYNDLALERGKS